MNVLFLTHRLPYAPNRGDRIRAYYLLREMATFARVALFSLVHDEEEAAAAAQVPFATAVRIARVTPWRNRMAGAAHLFSRRPLTLSLLDSPDALSEIAHLSAALPPDVVVAYCSSMARFGWTAPIAGRPLVVDMVDVDSGKWQALADTSRWPIRAIYRREALTLSRFEAEAVRRAVVTLVVNEREREALEAVAPGAPIQVIANGIDLDGFRPPDPPAANHQVIFTGVMNYGPNAEGALWLARRVWPLVREAEPGARLVIAGAAPSPAIRALPRHDSTIEVTGTVERVQPYLWQSAVAVAPLHLARGLQNKVLEGLAAGLPVVVTPAVLAGLPSAVHAGCRVAAEAPAFAAAVIDLLRRSPAERRRQAAAANLTDMSWSSRMLPLRRLLEGAAHRRVAG
jgi:sugar transferase (PEP-CTERM/EpsH1 system associated)